MGRISMASCKTAVTPTALAMELLHSCTKPSISWDPGFKSRVVNKRTHGVTITDAKCIISYHMLYYIYREIKIYIYRERECVCVSGSTLVQVMACCRMAPNHHMNQFIINSVLWQPAKTKSYLKNIPVRLIIVVSQTIHELTFLKGVFQCKFPSDSLAGAINICCAWKNKYADRVSVKLFHWFNHSQFTNSLEQPIRQWKNTRHQRGATSMGILPDT